MERFEMNGITWKILFVNPDDPILIDRTGNRTLACTDPMTKRLYFSNKLDTDMYMKVLLHELGHCVMVSYGLLDRIHQYVKPRYWIEAEEFICNFIAEYGVEIINKAQIISISLVH